MKKTLKEELERINNITFLIENDILGTLFDKAKTKINQIIDEPKKADLVSGNVVDFFNTLESTARKGGLKQQQYGSMTFQKDVETLQIGLILLGYELPKFGVDGKFGPETASAVNKFKQDHLGNINESSQELRQTINKLGYSEKSNELSSGGEISDNISSIVSEILKEFKQTSPSVNVTVTSGNDKFHQQIKNYTSKHKLGQAVDVTINPYNNNTSTAFISVLNKFKQNKPKFSFIDEYKNPSGKSTGGHFHLEYNENTNENEISDATPEMIIKLIDLLKKRGVNSDEIVKNTDTIKSGGSDKFTDINLKTNEGFEQYSNICQKIINTRKPNLLNISGKMLAIGARNALNLHGNYVPPQLALAQLFLEGGIGNPDPNSRPIKTRNPFNVGNTDNGKNNVSNDVQTSINNYFNLIASQYIGKRKTANDLVKNFVNNNQERYASASDYEAKLNNIIDKINQQTIT
jgi:peptidoglycan hydrolase-like protein with peptidoglycan-binding domain